MPPVHLGPIEGVHVLGAGAAFPPTRLTNDEVLLRLSPASWAGRRAPLPAEERDFLADGITQTLGVRSRAWAHLVGTPLEPATETTGIDLAISAARAALSDAAAHPSDLAMILCATSTPPRMTSTLSAAVGAALEARAACMDVRSGCAGGLFGLATGALLLGANTGPVLLVGVDTFSKIIPPTHKSAALTLGDGAGALVLSKAPGARLESVFLETDGALGRLVHTDGALPPTASEIERGGYWLSGAPDELAAAVPNKYAAAIHGALSHAGLQAESLDLFVCHAASPSLLDEVCRRSRVPRDRAVSTMESHANIGAASWLVALGEARAQGRLRAGSRVLVAAVGGGMSWAAAVLQC